MRTYTLTPSGGTAVKGTSFTKSLGVSELSNLTLPGEATNPIIAVTKEVPQVGLTNNTWNVEVDGSDYEIEDFAYAQTLTPSAVSGDITLTLGAGTWTANDVGKRVVGNGGEAIITSQSGTAVANATTTTNFTDTTTIGSGNWSMYGIQFDTTNGAEISNIDSTSYSVDLATASYDTKSLLVSSQSTNPNGVSVTDSGTKLYTIGTTNDTVYQYTLSTAYDISTAAYASKSFNHSTQTLAGYDIHIGNSGTKMYILGSSNVVYQYTLSTAYDVSTAVYDSKSYDFSSIVTGGTRFFIKEDGAKLYYLSNNSSSVSTVYQYTLSTAYDVSTAVYDSKSYDASTQITGAGEAVGIGFTKDGLTMILYSLVSDLAYQYTLSTAWDVSTAVYDSKTLSTVTQDGSMQGFTIADDGTNIKMYMAGITNETIYQYSIGGVSGGITAVSNQYLTAITNATGQIDTTFWTDINSMTVTDVAGVSASIDLSTASYDSVSFSVATQSTSPYGMVFGDSGTKIYVLDEGTDAFYQYNLTTAYDLSTASYSGNTISTAAATASAGKHSLAVSSDGLHLYFTFNGNPDTVYQFDFSTAWDLSTLTFNQGLVVDTNTPSCIGIEFSYDGTKMYLGDASAIDTYTLSTAWDISTASYSSTKDLSSDGVVSVRTIRVSDDGLNLMITSYDSTPPPYYARHYVLSTAFDMSTATVSSLKDISAEGETNLMDIYVDWDNIKMYTCGPTTDAIYQYTIGTSVNLGLAYYAVSNDNRTTWSVSSSANGVRNIVRNNLGTWEYNSNVTYGSETWTAATTNSEIEALKQAMTVAANKMDKAQLDAVTDANQFTLGTELDLAIILYTSDSSAIPSSDGVSINYDANAEYEGAVHGTDYDWTLTTPTNVEFTALTAGNYKVRVV